MSIHMIDEEREPSSRFATTLAKGLSILEAFGAGETLLGNSELAARTGMTRPTVARLSSTLAELGYLSYDDGRAKFRLAVRTLRIVRPFLADLKVRQIARPMMQELAASVRGTVSLGMIDGPSVVYIESARSGDVGPHVPDIGTDIPLVRAAIGRALSSLLAAPERKALRRRIQNEMPDLWASYGAAYEAGIKRCSEQGFCISLGDWMPTIHAAAVPLFRSRETGVCIALNCGVPAFRLRPGELESQIVPRLTALTASVRALLHEDDE